MKMKNMMMMKMKMMKMKMMMMMTRRRRKKKRKKKRMRKNVEQPAGPAWWRRKWKSNTIGGEVAEKAGEEAVLFWDSRGKPGYAGDVGRK